MSDLERAFNALSAKTGTYNTLWQYADGDHPLTYTNERLREIFRSLDARFTENWCSLVLGACLERIEMQGWQVAGDEVAQAILQALWEGNDLDAQADEVHEAALVCGESFVIVWPDADGQPQVYYNDPRMVHVFYDDESPSVKTFGAKWWDDADGKRRLTLYYADRLEYYVSLGKKENVDSAAAFMADPETPTAPNPFGEIPVFHFRTSIRTTKSDLKDVIPIQNGINKLLADMMVAAEYGAFKQRYIISNADGTGKLKNAPNEIWDVPAGDGVGQQTQVGEFSATDLRNYLDAIDRLALAVGIITRTPKYYFMVQGGDPSGEALIAMEAPLNKKAAKRISRFVPTWRQVGAFMLKVNGQETPDLMVTPVFAEPTTIQPVTRATIRTAEVGAGIPLTTALRREGWTQEELDAMAADKEAEQAGQAQLQEMMLEEARRRFDQGPGVKEQESEDGDQESEDMSQGIRPSARERGR